jgi:hypothetical protein
VNYTSLVKLRRFLPGDTYIYIYKCSSTTPVCLLTPPVHTTLFFVCTRGIRRSDWPRGLRLRSAATRLLRLCVRIPPGTWTSVSSVLSVRSLCDELIFRSEEFYRLWFVVVCDVETSRMRRLWPTGGGRCCAKQQKGQEVYWSIWNHRQIV